MAHVARNDDDVNVLCLSADHTSESDILDTTLTFLQNDKFWCHAKNHKALIELLKHNIE